MSDGVLIATGNTAEIHLRDGIIVKIYSRHSRATVEVEASNQRFARSIGLPVPAVFGVSDIDGRAVLEMEHAPGVPMKDLLTQRPQRLPELLARSIEIQRRVHAHTAPELRRMSDRLREQIASVHQLGEDRKAQLNAMLEDVGEEFQFCHGDLHVQNLIVNGDDITVIDWMDATRGNVRLDVCRSYVIYKEVDVGFAEAYLTEFCRQSGLERDEVLRWEPVIVAARMSE